MIISAPFPQTETSPGSPPAAVSVPLGAGRRTQKNRPRLGPRVQSPKSSAVQFSKTHRGVSETLCRIRYSLRSNYRFDTVFRRLLGEFSRNGPPNFLGSVIRLPPQRRSVVRTGRAPGRRLRCCSARATSPRVRGRASWGRGLLFEIYLHVQFGM